MGVPPISEWASRSSGICTEKVDMAKALKAKGVDADIIAEVSGLPARNIESM